MEAWHAAAALACGFSYEACMVFWTSSSARGSAAVAAMWSMICGCIGLLGIWLAVEDLATAPALILGYGLGTYTAVRLKSR